MSEASLLICTCACSLSIAIALMRQVSGDRTPGHDLQRLLAAVRRATSDFLWRENRVLGALLALVVVGVSLPTALWPRAGTSPAASLVPSVASLVVGAVLAACVARVVRWVAERSVVAAIQPSSAESSDLPATLRGASAAALLVDGSSLLLTVAAFVVHRLLGSEPMGASDSLPVQLGRVLAPLSLGAICTATVYRVGGSNFHTATGVTSATLESRYARIARGAEHNPVLVAELVGDSVGAITCRAAEAFAATTFANCALLTLASAVSEANGWDAAGTLGIALLPLLIRGSALVGCALCMSSLHGTLQPSARGALLGAATSYAVVTATGVFGACYWLVGMPHLAAYVGAGLLGVLAPLASWALLFWLTRKALEPAIDPGSLPRPETSVARALGLGLQQTWPPLAVVGACLTGAWALGSSVGFRHATALALAVAVAGLAGATPLNLAQALLSPLSESVRRVQGFRLESDRASQHPPAEPSEAQSLVHVVANLGHTQSILAAGAVALLAAATLPLVGTWGTAPTTDASLAHPVVLLAGLLGAMSLSFFVGSVLRTCTRTANLLASELHQRLEPAAGVSSVGALGRRSTNFAPSVELARDGAAASVLPLSLLAVGTPLLVGGVLRATYGASDGMTAARGLMAYATIAALTGCCAALAAQGALAALASPLYAPGGSATAPATQFIERSVGPAALLGLQAAVIASTASAPLLFT